MNPENTSRLLSRFPGLFKYTDKDSIRTSSPHPSLMYFGFDCYDGWYNILHDCFSQIQDVYNQWSEAEKEAFWIFQVKEKFGTLRIYVNQRLPGTHPIMQIIIKTEVLSSDKCEVCGENGRFLTRNHRYYARCDKHAEE